MHGITLVIINTSSLVVNGVNRHHAECLSPGTWFAFLNDNHITPCRWPLVPIVVLITPLFSNDHRLDH